MQDGRQLTPKECEVHTRFGYIRLYFSALGDKMNRFEEIIPQASGIEGIPAYLYEQSNRLALANQTR